jgi:hypothetical protein
MSNSAPTTQKCLHLTQALLFDPRYFWTLASLVILADAFLTGLIIRYVHCQSTSMLFDCWLTDTLRVQTLKLIGRRTWFISRCFLEESTTIAELLDPLDRWCKRASTKSGI